MEAGTTQRFVARAAGAQLVQQLSWIGMDAPFFRVDAQFNGDRQILGFKLFAGQLEVHVVILVKTESHEAAVTRVVGV